MQLKINFLKACNGDCILISFTDSKNKSSNILVDGGTERCYYDQSNNSFGELKLEIDKIRSKLENIDLLILTHIDNDHICGLLKWFEMDVEAHALVKNIWFNSGKLIAEYLNEPANPDLDLDLKIFTSPETGANEAVKFENYILDKKIWERKIVLNGSELNENGIHIQVLTPNRERLIKLLKEFKKKTGDSTYTGGSSKDWGKSLKALVEEEEAEYKKPKDNSLTNPSSITFILSIKDKNFLFLADAPSNEIVNALNELGYSKENPLTVELMKVSHHGSKNNTCNELLDIIKTDHYLISTDSSVHGHPDKRTLARILKSNPNATFHFNYKDVKDGLLNKQDFLNFQHLRAFATSEFEYKYE